MKARPDFISPSKIPEHYKSEDHSLPGPPSGPHRLINSLPCDELQYLSRHTTSRGRSVAVEELLSPVPHAHERRLPIIATPVAEDA